MSAPRGLLVALLALLGPWRATAAAQEAPALAEWTVMVYMSGDNELEAYVATDLEAELGALGSSAAVQVVALADRGPAHDTSYGDWQGTKLFHVTPGITAAPENALEDWGERNLADPQTLVEFVAWSRAHYPAKHYALYLWGHGWNWHPGYVLADYSSQAALDMHELAPALPLLGWIDFVGFDGCNMASIEVAALWHGHAAALAHSQEYVDWEGVQYDLVLAKLAASPSMSAAELAIATSQSATADKTWSAIVLDQRLQRLLGALDEWALALRRGLPRWRPEYERAFAATQSFVDAPEDRDLFDMASEIRARVPDAQVRARSLAVMRAVQAVVLEEHHDQAYSGAHGLSIYHITRASEKQRDFEYYRGLDFAAKTHWDEFLEAYAQ